jgi:hypothetical protein
LYGTAPYIELYFIFLPVPDSIRSVDPDPDSELGSGSRSRSRRAKRPTKMEKVQKFHVLKCWMFSFEG